jgi:plastocyanin
MFATSLLGLALLPFAAAAVIDIKVGGPEPGKLEYSPEAIAAVPGDQVVFHFYPKNHTVTRSSFADPCGPLVGDGAFDSGFIPVPANQTDNWPTYTVTVNDTAPIWVYCRQAGKTPASHCGAGMVFAINCGADGAPNSFTNFKNSAKAVGEALKAAGGGDTGYGSGAGAGASNTWTAAYGGVTVPAVAAPSAVTQTITLEASTWTTVYNSYPGSPEPTPASLTGTVHKVIVGGPNASLVFDPPHVDAKPRDIIMFEFHQKNHTVTQSSFADPCRKLNANGTVGFDTEFMPVAEGAADFPTWNLTINDTAPIWAYCKQKTPKSHCGAGMVFAVNSVENSERNFTAYQNLAKALNASVAADTAVPTTSAPPGDNGALSMNVGGTMFSLFVAAVVATLL